MVGDILNWIHALRESPSTTMLWFCTHIDPIVYSKKKQDTQYFNEYFNEYQQDVHLLYIRVVETHHNNWNNMDKFTVWCKENSSYH